MNVTALANELDQNMCKTLGKLNRKDYDNMIQELVVFGNKRVEEALQEVSSQILSDFHVENMIRILENEGCLLDISTPLLNDADTWSIRLGFGASDMVHEVEICDKNLQDALWKSIQVLVQEY